jgi:hypothetical protein
MKNTKEVVKRWIEVALEEGKLTSWENEFLVSVGEQLERKGSLSEKQEEIVERIYAEKTSL